MKTNFLQIVNINESLLQKTITVGGWVRSIRVQKKIAFIELNDGSSVRPLQIILENTFSDFEKTCAAITVGSSLLLEGILKESPGGKQSWELVGTKILFQGECPTSSYPLQKKKHSFEFLRSIPHLRTRTNTYAAVARMRSTLSLAVHKFFEEENFFYVHTPILTSSDTEGLGELFLTTTLPLNNLPKTEEGSVDFSKDFFKSPTFLTVSGQLNAEALALSLSRVYTFGPTFRAENSHTTRHLAEFWMIEPEVAFYDLKQNMDLCEAFLKYVIREALEKRKEDILFFDEFIAPGIQKILEECVSTNFAHITYTDAIHLLQQAEQKFAYPVEWGVDLQTEHERYLTENIFKKPLFVTDYPAKIKAFYMKQNPDQKTVSAMDLLVPRIGELVGGSQREDSLSLLEKKMESLQIPKEKYWWYLQLREFGGAPHSGFGLGFERLVQFVTGMENIRDIALFPRVPGQTAL